MKVIGWHLVRLVAEAQSTIVGGTVGQIRRSADRTRLAFVIDSVSGKYYLVVGVRGESPAIYWTRSRDDIRGWATYEKTEVFNRVRGGRLLMVGMAAKDRVIRFEFERLSQSDRNRHRVSLVASWIGSASNIWLIDSESDDILESFHPEAADSSQRLLLPPAPGLPDWQTMSFPDYRVLRQTHADTPLIDFLRLNFWGIDSGLARLVTSELRKSRMGNNADELPASLIHWEEFQTLQRVATAAIDPATPLGLPAGASDQTELRFELSDNSEAKSLAELLAAIDAQTSGDSGDDLRRAQLASQIESLLRKNERRITSLDRTIAESERADEYKFAGDLLSANRQHLRKGETKAVLEDWRTGRTVEIALNPARSPQQNIDDYYRKSRKAAHAVDAARSARPHRLREQDRLRTALMRLSNTADTATPIEEIAESLGMTIDSPRAGKQNVSPRLPYREFIIGKDRLWVGRSSRDNDELTLRYARPHDIFFHVHGAAGSHVILKRDSKDTVVDKDVLTLSAQVAAYFSKAKHAGLVPVVYTEARFVRKPRKAPAGTVSIEREKTIMVRPIAPPGYHDHSPSG